MRGTSADQYGSLKVRLTRLEPRKESLMANGVSEMKLGDPRIEAGSAMLAAGLLGRFHAKTVNDIPAQWNIEVWIPIEG